MRWCSDGHAWAESILPIHTLQLVQQGRVIAQSTAAPPAAGVASARRFRLVGPVGVTVGLFRGQPFLERP